MLEKVNRDKMKLYEGVRTEEEYFNRRLALNLILGLEKGFMNGDLEGSLNQLANSIDIAKEISSIIEKAKGISFEVEKAVSYLTERVIQSGVQLGNLILTFKSFNYSIEEFELAAESLLIANEQKMGIDSQTPNFLNQLMVDLVAPTKGSLYDGTMGLGDTLLTANRYAKSQGQELQLYGQELNEETYYLATMKFYILGLDKVTLAQGDVLKYPRFLVEGQQLMQFDYVAMNFPFGLRDEDGTLMQNETYGRLLYGTPSRAGVDYLFISHALRSLKETGRAAVIVPNGTLFRTNSDARIRANLVTADVVEAVITLPEQLFANTSIQTNVIIFNKAKVATRKNKILFINAEKLFEVKGRRQRVMTEEHLQLIQQTYEAYSEKDEFSKVVPSTELREYNLLPSEYVVQRGMKIEGYGQVLFDLNKIMEASQGQTLGTVGNVYRGVSVVGRHEPVEDGEFMVINLADVKDGEIQVSQLARYNFSSNTRTDNYVVEEGDLLVSSRGAQIKIAVVPKHDGKMLLSQNFIGIRLQSGVDAVFLKTYLESPVGQYLLAQKLTGSAILTLTPRQLMEVPVILPESEAQIQIMNEYEQKKAELEERLKQLQAQQKQNQLGLYEKMGLSELMTLE